MISGGHHVQARIALLMATRDQSGTLLAAVRSLLTQSHQHFTLTIVDDGSQRPVSETLADVQDARLQILSIRPQGQIPALNLAMQKSKPASFYAVVYASCFYAPNFLSVMLQRLIRTPQASGVFCHFCQGWGRDLGAIFSEPFFDSNELLVRDFMGPGVVFRQAAFRDSGGLFLSEKQGLLESWQRMNQKFGPFSQHPEVLVRWLQQTYDMPPQRPVLDPEKQVYAQLKATFLLPDNQQVDNQWISLLSQAGHPIYAEENLPCRPQAVLCGQIENIAPALQLASVHYAPLLLTLNQPQELEAFEASHYRFILGSTTVATSSLSVAAPLSQQYNHKALVYVDGMTPREVNRLLSRIPLMLYRQRVVILVRAYGPPEHLEYTLKSLNQLNRPPEMGELLILCMEDDPKLTRWLEQNHYPYFIAQKPNYFAELLFLLQQIPASFVLSVDSGVELSSQWFYSLWPLLANPRIGMVSGHLTAGPGSQAAPIRAQTPAELAQFWQTYRPSRPMELITHLSDAAFLIRKQAFEWILARYPDCIPFLDETLLSKLMLNYGYRHLLQRTTVAFNHNTIL